VIVDAINERLKARRFGAIVHRFEPDLVGLSTVAAAAWYQILRRRNGTTDIAARNHA
jgi:hypothetical protein